MKKFKILFFVLFVIGSLSATTIYDIQYTTNAGDGTYPSPMVDQEVTITGIVTATNYGHGGEYQSFYMCDLPEIGIGAWHGIMIFNTDAEQSPEVGDEVEVSGTVTEYYGLTEIGYVTVSIVSSGNPVPAPVSIICSVLSTTENYECVFAQLTDLTVVQEQDEFGQWLVTDGTGICQVDDEFFYLDTVDPPIVISEGDTYPVIKGIVDYSYNEFGMNPRSPLDFEESGFSENEIVSVKASLSSNFPNPFNPETNIAFSTVSNDNTQIVIYNMRGQLVKTLVDKTYPIGSHSEVWNGTDENGRSVSSGMYFYKMKSGRYTTTKKMILMK
ncbi:MAG: T9SS type A sorting domain-containing protein [Candidatus Cloacimonetes bacterium]|nr:T9SS type A sorting domain-containing protein [Candidatus Cloacimonadota bacterium]